MSKGQKDVEKIIAKLIEQGWTITRGKKHYMACPPDKTKRCVPIPTSIGEGRGLANLIADLRRSGAVL